MSPTSPSPPNTLVLKCLPGWDRGLQPAFTLKVLLGKNDTSKQKAAVGGYDSRGAGSEKAEEWITGASVRHVNDQTQENDLANSWKDVGLLEKGVLAVRVEFPSFYSIGISCRTGIYSTGDSTILSLILVKTVSEIKSIWAIINITRSKALADRSELLITFKFIMCIQIANSLITLMALIKTFVISLPAPVRLHSKSP